MQLQYGTYSFTANECDVKAVSETLVAGGRPYGRRTMLRVRGRMYTAGQADTTAKMNQLTTALQVPFLDLVLLCDDSSRSATLLTNAGSLTGVVITKGPDFEDNMGAEYATQRTFSFSAQAEYPFAGTQNDLLAFSETLSFTGGGPRIIFRPNLDGPWQKQIVYPQTTFRVSQRGAATGYRAYPVVPEPTWPDDELPDRREISPVSPARVGLNWQAYPITWKYEFESVDELVGVPNLWPMNL